MLNVLSMNGSLSKGATSGKLLKGMASQTLSVATSKPQAVELIMWMACFFLGKWPRVYRPVIVYTMGVLCEPKNFECSVKVAQNSF